MLRHVYQPLLDNGVPKGLAGCIVFGVSGVFHELLIGVPLHRASLTRAWAFWGIMGQVRVRNRALRRRQHRATETLIDQRAPHS